MPIRCGLVTVHTHKQHSTHGWLTWFACVCPENMLASHDISKSLVIFYKKGCLIGGKRAIDYHLTIYRCRPDTSPWQIHTFVPGNCGSTVAAWPHWSPLVMSLTIETSSNQRWVTHDAQMGRCYGCHPKILTLIRNPDQQPGGVPCSCSDVGPSRSSIMCHDTRGQIWMDDTGRWPPGRGCWRGLRWLPAHSKGLRVGTHEGTIKYAYLSIIY